MSWVLLRKGLDPSFDFKRLAFVQEACGRQQEEHLISAQSSVNNARKSSLTAAFNLFATNLANDQVMQDKFQASADMCSQRQRSVLVHSLEARGKFCFFGISYTVPCVFSPKKSFKRVQFQKNWNVLNLPHTLQKMHTTAWKLVSDFTNEVVPTFDVSGGKTPQGLYLVDCVIIYIHVTQCKKRNSQLILCNQFASIHAKKELKK